MKTPLWGQGTLLSNRPMIMHHEVPWHEAYCALCIMHYELRKTSLALSPQSRSSNASEQTDEICRRCALHIYRSLWSSLAVARGDIRPTPRRVQRNGVLAAHPSRGRHGPRTITCCHKPAAGPSSDRRTATSAIPSTSPLGAGGHHPSVAPDPTAAVSLIMRDEP